MVNNIVFISQPEELADAYTDVVNSLPGDLELRPRIIPWSGGLTGSQMEVEKTLDKHELRQVTLVAGGYAAHVALMVAASQPPRINRVILVSPTVKFDSKTAKRLTSILKFTPGFMFKNRNKADLIEEIKQGASEDHVTEYAKVTTPTLIINADSPTTDTELLMGTLANVREVQVGGENLPIYRNSPALFADKISEFIRE